MNIDQTLWFGSIYIFCFVLDYKPNNSYTTYQSRSYQIDPPITGIQSIIVDHIK